LAMSHFDWPITNKILKLWRLPKMEFYSQDRNPNCLFFYSPTFQDKRLFVFCLFVLFVMLRFPKPLCLFGLSLSEKRVGCLESFVSAITQTCTQAIVIVTDLWFCVSNFF
jgi:hypothetical protein